MLTPGQSRAARGWLNWTQAELAKRASVGLSTLRDFESEERTSIPNNVAAIRRALEDGGASAFLAATDGLTPTNASPVTQGLAPALGKRSETATGGRRGKRSSRSAQAL